MTNHQDTSTEREALKPCPFCGKTHTAEITTAQELAEQDSDYDGEFWQHSDSFAVICNASRPNGPGGCGASGGFFATKAEAIAAWNRRAALASRDEVAPSDFPPEKVPAQQTQDPDRLRIRFEDRFGALFGTDRHADNGEYVEPDTNAAWLVYSAVAERQGPEIGAVTGEFLYSRWWGFYSTIMNAKGENLDGPYYQFSELPEPVQRAHNMLAEELHAAQQPQGQAVSDEQIIRCFQEDEDDHTDASAVRIGRAILALRDGPTIKDSLTVERVPLSEDWATIAGLESAVYHLSTLVDQQRALLAESEDVFGRDGHGGRYEDGECGLIDRIRAHLEMTAPPPKGITAKEQGNGN